MEQQNISRWMLAFDASCGKCRQIASEVKKSGSNNLEIVPLSRCDVVELRERAFKGPAPHAPTLLRIRDDKVWAWTGIAMGIRLPLLLGLGGTRRFLSALGVMKHQNGIPENDSPGRRRFLGLAGLGVAVAVLGARATPAMADPGPNAAEKWVQANINNLPQRYNEFITHDMTHRRAIYQALTPSTRRQLWLAQLSQYRSTHANLTPEQDRILTVAEHLLADKGALADSSTVDFAQKIKSLGEEAIAVFGKQEAGNLLAQLGPPDAAPVTVAATCSCNVDEDFCGPQDCRSNIVSCSRTSGCGWVWNKPCNGLCCEPTTAGWLCF
ncbi:bacteriocin fulvocin C-related protein [Nonomuraea sp. LPB2021202275-12-8]|uniref:bacteriocin fulvocin C-related protein n=1 Tax=Nonomuraea sp. LPB2021202275-12-8 TaxID=3120159 RepID=UPI00300CDA80